MDRTSERTRGLAILYAAVFVEIGIAMPFLPIWLAGLDLDATVIGALVALPIATKIVATAPIVSLIDRGLPPRTILVVGSFGAALTYALMPLSAGSGWLLLALLIALNAVASAPLVPSIDYMALAACRRSGSADYARIRLWGSIGFLCANLAGGVLLGRFGQQVTVPLLLTGLAIVAGLLALKADESPVPAAPRETHEQRIRLPLVLWLVIAAAALIQAGHAAVYSFGSITWTRAGLSGGTVGFLWAFGVASEIVLFAVLGRLPERWRSPFLLIGIGAGAALLRAVGLAYAGDSLMILIAVQGLHAFTFGATHYGSMLAVSRYAPDRARGRAQGTASAMTALASAASTLACGLSYDTLGAAATFLLMMPLSFTGLAAILLARQLAARTNTLWTP